MAAWRVAGSVARSVSLRDLGVVRVNFPVPPAKADEILPILDRLANLMRQLRD